MALEIKVGMEYYIFKRRPAIIRKQPSLQEIWGKLGSQILLFNNPIKCKLSAYMEGLKKRGSKIYSAAYL